MAEKILMDDEEEEDTKYNSNSLFGEEFKTSILCNLQTPKFLTDDFEELEEEKAKQKPCYLESSDSEIDENSFQVRYLTSDDEALQTMNTIVSNNENRTSHRRARRSLFASSSGRVNDIDDDYVPSSTQRKRHQIPELTEPLRPRSTRSHARIARTRISFNINDCENDESEEEEEFETEDIVKLDEISMSSESENDVFITFEELKKAQTSENDTFCTICAESKSQNPVRALCCGQFIGCKNCVKLWYRTTNISHLNSRSPLSRGQSHDNHKRCPFCRNEWPEKMLIKSAFIM